MSTWHLHTGTWWMVQWCFDGWISFGIHIDFRTRTAAKAGIKYGPYVDLHLGCLIVSVGRNPKYSGELDCSSSVGRGGIRGDG